MLLDQEDVIPGEFPADANVRIMISGLAFCELTTQLSKIHFLRHPQYHDLKMKIYKRKNPSDTPIPIDSYDFPFESGVTITSDTEAPSSILASVGEGEFHLNELINLQTRHKKPLRPKFPLPVRPPTLLSIYRCSFYTERKTNPDYGKFTLVDLDNGKPVFEERDIGYSMGGKINCRDDGATLIAISGIEPKVLLRQENGEQWLYDITFSNHCTETDYNCIRAIKPDNTDFRYYYDVLEEPGNPRRKFKLIKVAPGITEKVGACNVVILEPRLDDPVPS
jgi:hypothetical protein